MSVLNRPNIDPPPATKDLERLLIVGGGMAGYGLCRGMIDRGANQAYEIKILGEEPRPAYDRVNVSKLFSGRSAEDLLLAPADWYAANSIKLETGRRVTRIDRAAKTIVDDHGNAEPYDRLVLATGSRPWVPPIEGTSASGVFVYRTIDDLESIQQFVGKHKAKTSAVIGGGLLGLEAAKVMLDLGLSTSILEVAPGLMPRQLDAQAARVLKERVESLGVRVHVTRRTSAIEQRDSGLTLQFENAAPMNVDILVIAAGIRPRDELGKEAGLTCGERGGIEVDETLQTSDPNIYAIGECASFSGRLYGLVAPCYRMADVLAERLCGDETAFTGSDESVELKLMGVPVVTIGKALGESTSGVVVHNESDNGYREILLEQGRIVGASGVGEWDDLDLIRLAIAKGKRLWPHQRARFLTTGTPFNGSGLPVHQWPADSIVCSCLGVTRGVLSEAIDEGASTSEELSTTTGASTACGSCNSLVCTLVGAPAQNTQVVGATAVLIASVLAIALSLFIVIAPSIPFATSVQDDWREIDVLWRDGFAKQVTGYTLLVVIVIAMTFSLRKRSKLITAGDYGLWRAAHSALGTALLVGMVVHTGLRMGSNLNFMLSTIFLVLSLVGGLAGLASSLESKLTGDLAMLVRAWRPKLTLVHICLFGPLPALLLAHIISVYWY